MNRLAIAIATAGGAGYAPIAPGTAGSAVGLLVYALTWRWPGSWQIALLATITIVGTWASHRAAAHFGKHDPGPVVIDEVAGQLLTLLLTGAGWVGALGGFFLFRALDIVKPWPARRLESLPGGWGIMADDLMAGLYGLLLVRAAGWVIPGSL
jgi:phosphatidylglycerophosphatase A